MPDPRNETEPADRDQRGAERRSRHRQLLEIEGGRIEAMRISALAERDAGGAQSEIVAAAKTSEHEYRAGLAALAKD